MLHFRSCIFSVEPPAMQHIERNGCQLFPAHADRIEWLENIVKYSCYNPQWEYFKALAEDSE